MATVTGYTAEHMDEIANTCVVDGHISGDDLILTQRDDTEINAGSVRGPQGPPGTDPSIVICDSGSRPTGGDLFEGLHIYETDTDLEWVYNGTAWVPPPILLDSADGNMLTSSTDGLMAQMADGAMAAIGSSGKMAGTNFPDLDTAKLKFQFGNSVRTTDADGLVIVEFPVAFPATLGIVLLQPGELILGGVNGTSWQMCLVPVGCSKTQFMARCERNIDDRIALGAVRFNWLAIGI